MAQGPLRHRYHGQLLRHGVYDQIRTLFKEQLSSGRHWFVGLYERRRQDEVMAGDITEKSEMIPDQGKKIRYLVKTRGDQRSAANNKRLALGETVTRNGAFYPSPIVTNQAQLAEALAVNGSTVTRWVKEELSIPGPCVKEICRIFKIDEHVFREQDLEALKKFCSTGAVRFPLDWRGTFLGKIDVRGSIMLSDPFSGQIDRTRYAGIAEDGKDEPAMTEVPAGAPFWMDFVSPHGRDGKPLWAGWPMLLFNHDVRVHGFKCFLPAYRTHDAFKLETFPAKGSLILPRKPVLKHPVEDVGEFEMILIVSQETFSSDITDLLSDKTAHGALLDAALQRLADWIGDRVRRGAADMGKACYRVVAKPEDAG